MSSGYFALEDLDRGFEWLAKAIEHKYWDIGMYVRAPTTREMLADDPRYLELVKLLESAETHSEKYDPEGW